jgi:hypothetical protein
VLVADLAGVDADHLTGKELFAAAGLVILRPVGALAPAVEQRVVESYGGELDRLGADVLHVDPLAECLSGLFI